MSTPDATLVRDRLLSWYRRSARSLPWRSDPTPYRVLLSEFMLQQTRVDTALPYFERFVARWPSLEALADAPEEEVVREWAGLGYYRRARNLHRAARAAVDGGGLPADPEALRELPGVGPYTAGAIASIAFGVRTPVVDGNVERVLSRLDGREAPPRSAAGRRALWQRVDELLPSTSPGDLNQALMELGATVCLPRRPGCAECPVGDLCVALATGRVTELPVLPPRKKPVPVRGVAGLLVLDEGILLGRRAERGLLGGMWEPIGAEVPPRADPREVLAAAFAERAGVRVEVGPFVGRVEHVFTHRRLSLDVFEVVRLGGEPAAGSPYVELRVLEPARAGEEVPLSALATKTLGLVRQPALPLAAEGSR